MARVNVHVVPAAVGVALEQQGRLVETVHDPVGGDVLRRAGQPGERRVQIGHVDDVAHDLTFFDHTRPPGEGRRPHTALGEVALAAAVDHGQHAPARRGAVHHRSVVGHGDEQRVLRDAQLLQLVHDLADESVELGERAGNLEPRNAPLSASPVRGS